RCRNPGRTACRRRPAPQHTTCCRRDAAWFDQAWRRIRGYPKTGYPSLYPHAPQGPEDGRDDAGPRPPEKLASGMNERRTTRPPLIVVWLVRSVKRRPSRVGASMDVAAVSISPPTASYLSPLAPALRSAKCLTDGFPTNSLKFEG